MSHISQLHPAYLWIGKQEDLVSKTEQFLKQILCKHNGCNNCITCKQISLRQHHMCLWLTPENQYTVNSLDPIFSNIAYTLEENTHFFFILERADLLSITCANSLLKSLEEPPPGYHFILLSPWLEGLLPTVVSRCVIETLTNNSTNKISTILKFFTKAKDASVTDFVKELDKLKTLDRDILYIIDQIYFYWMHELKKVIEIKDQQSISRVQKTIDTINKCRECPPMPGSTKIFLKNLYLLLNA